MGITGISVKSWGVLPLRDTTSYKSWGIRTSPRHPRIAAYDDGEMFVVLLKLDRVLSSIHG